MKETITSIVDVITEYKLAHETEIVMKIGIIPNDVNGNYHTFKIMIYSILEGVIVPLATNILESSRKRDKTTTINLDF